ncbi:MAG: ABC-2 family transporter protein [Anaerolineae bacterium]|nr:ABC-2 family transporter protein [Anaerolineae bacterium]
MAINYRGAWALIRRTWMMWVAARSFFWLLAFGWMIPPLIYLLVWSTAAGDSPVGGMSRDQFIVYYLVLIVVNQLTYSQTNWTVGDVIRYGGMNSLLLRPLHPFWDAVSTQVAGTVVYMLFTIPVTLILALLLRPAVHFTLPNLLAFVPALAMAWALRFFWGYWLALLAFWATRADALLSLQDALIFLLAGQVAPTALLPDLLRRVSTVLPFRYMLGFPVEILIGQLSGSQIGAGLAVQAAWLGIAVTLFVTMWREGVKRYAAVGG